MLFLHGLVRFKSSLTLEEVATLISERLCGGVPFVKTREFDEVPGVKLERNIMGLTIRVCGEGGEYGIHFDSDDAIYPKGDVSNLDVINLSEYVGQALNGIERIDVMPP
jgi:hypothetical protein